MLKNYKNALFILTNIYTICKIIADIAVIKCIIFVYFVKSYVKL